MFVIEKQNKRCNEIKCNFKKNFRRVVCECVKKYFHGVYEADLNVFDALDAELTDVVLSANDARELKKILNIFFLGQIVGLPTLHSILQKYDIGSNNHQISYKKLCKRLTINEISKIYASVFETQVLAVLQKMSVKDSSCWSRELVTAVLDDSIFKQWHGSQDPEKSEKDFERCFGKFFSGQFMSAVYGFKVVTFALCINGILYPLYFDFVKKTAEGHPKPDKATKVAQKLVKISRKMGSVFRKSEKEGNYTAQNPF